MLERLKRWLLPATPAKPAAAMPATAAVPTPPPAAAPASASVAPAASTVSAGPLVIDVRSEREFHATAVAHAINVPLPQLAQCIAELAQDKATPLVLDCASGARSGSACQLLQQLGYTQVTNAGGLYAAAAHLQREVRR